MLKIKRVYEEPASDDGYRVLVDRLWPRGVSKEKAKIDLWLRDVSPSSELRKWFGHDPNKWLEFKKRFESELVNSSQNVEKLREIASLGDVTLVYGAKDEKHNNAVVIKSYLENINV